MRFLYTVMLAGLSVLSLNAATSFSFGTTNGLKDDGYSVSPYTGTLGGKSVTLFCDDFNDSGTYSSANVTTVSSSNLTKARFDTSNPNSAYPTGTTLYEEMAWLFTQMMATGQTDNNKKAIQEAVWHMTSTSSSVPDNMVTTVSTASNTGQQSYMQWITDAGNYYNTEQAGYLTANYDQWVIITDVNAANCTVGTYSSGHCHGSQSQEYLAFYNSTGVPGHSEPAPPTTAPEPASFLLIGSGLAVACLLRRRAVR